MVFPVTAKLTGSIMIPSADANPTRPTPPSSSSPKHSAGLSARRACPREAGPRAGNSRPDTPPSVPGLIAGPFPVVIDSSPPPFAGCSLPQPYLVASARAAALCPGRAGRSALGHIRRREASPAYAPLPLGSTEGTTAYPVRICCNSFTPDDSEQRLAAAAQAAREYDLCRQQHAQLDERELSAAADLDAAQREYAGEEKDVEKLEHLSLTRVLVARHGSREDALARETRAAPGCWP